MGRWVLPSGVSLTNSYGLSLGGNSMYAYNSTILVIFGSLSSQFGRAMGSILAIQFPIKVQKYQFLILKGHDMINNPKEFELDVLNNVCATRVKT